MMEPTEQAQNSRLTALDLGRVKTHLARVSALRRCRRSRLYSVLTMPWLRPSVA